MRGGGDKRSTWTECWQGELCGEAGRAALQAFYKLVSTLEPEPVARKPTFSWYLSEAAFWALPWQIAAVNRGCSTARKNKEQSGKIKREGWEGAAEELAGNSWPAQTLSRQRGPCCPPSESVEAAQPPRPAFTIQRAICKAGRLGSGTLPACLPSLLPGFWKGL